MSRIGALARGGARCAATLLAASLAAAPPAAGRGSAAPLSGPAAGDPQEIALAHLRAELPALGLLAEDLEDARLSHRRQSPRSGVTALFWRQELHGIPVEGADLGVAVDPEGRVLRRWSRFVRGLRAVAPAPRPGITAARALRIAAASVGLAAPATPAVVARPGGPTRELHFAAGALARRPIRVHLVYWPRASGGVTLAWRVSLLARGPHWWDWIVDAADGTVLARRDQARRDAYRVFPQPLESPDSGPRALIPDPADASASPLGWHDLDGSPGAEFDDTQGNNILAQEDGDGNDTGGFRPDGGPSRVFDFPLDLSQQPSGYQAAALSNVFYWANLAHDLFHAYGFDPPSGSFQNHNYGAGGLGADPVFVDIQDGLDVNNAVFFPAPEGSAALMELYLFEVARVEVLAPAALAGLRPAGYADFGPALDATGVTGELEAAQDAGPVSSDACSPLDNAAAISGKVCLVDRGDCLFVDKAQNCQAAGAIAMLVANNVPGGVINMSGTGTITIPSLMLSQAEGAGLRDALAQGVSVNLHRVPDRDPSLDATIVLHEYAHGVTTRLSGGAGNTSCLISQQGGSLGEGWSDFYALAFTADAGDLPEQGRAIGAYSTGLPVGVRSFPYSTDPAVHPASYAEIATRSLPHGAGEIWALALWEAYWALVRAYGFDADLAAGGGGNNRALVAVTEALSLQSCEPTFLDARDAVLAAEGAISGGADACLFWEGFAARGLGDGASDSGDPNSLVVSEDFSMPAECQAYCADGAAQGPEECDDGNRLDFDGCHSVCLLEDQLELVGTAQGGGVTLVVKGVEITVPTSSGQSAAQVVQALADAINAEPSLGAQGISAQAEGALLRTGSSIESVSVDDPGLQEELPLPALSPALRSLLALLLAAAGLGAPALRGRGRFPRS